VWYVCACAHIFRLARCRWRWFIFVRDLWCGGGVAVWLCVAVAFRLVIFHNF
jgi:hypothetical protein